MRGRRREDVAFGSLPDDIQPGDIWKYVDENGNALSARAHCNGDSPSSPVHQNLCDTMWGYSCPNDLGIGLLCYHTVREEDDGTISIRPNDGSSNSILHTKRWAGEPDKTWHGYVEHNEWTAV